MLDARRRRSQQQYGASPTVGRNRTPGEARGENARDAAWGLSPAGSVEDFVTPREEPPAASTIRAERHVVKQRQQLTPQSSERSQRDKRRPGQRQQAQQLSDLKVDGQFHDNIPLSLLPLSVSLGGSQPPPETDTREHSAATSVSSALSVQSLVQHRQQRQQSRGHSWHQYDSGSGVRDSRIPVAEPPAPPPASAVARERNVEGGVLGVGVGVSGQHGESFLEGYRASLSGAAVLDHLPLLEQLPRVSDQLEAALHRIETLDRGALRS